MADNYLEKQYERYLEKQKAAEKARLARLKKAREAYRKLLEQRAADRAAACAASASERAAGDSGPELDTKTDK